MGSSMSGRLVAGGIRLAALYLAVSLVLVALGLAWTGRDDEPASNSASGFRFGGLPGMNGELVSPPMARPALGVPADGGPVFAFGDVTRDRTTLVLGVGTGCGLPCDGLETRLEDAIAALPAELQQALTVVVFTGRGYAWQFEAWEAALVKVPVAEAGVEAVAGRLGRPVVAAITGTGQPRMLLFASDNFAQLQYPLDIGAAALSADLAAVLGGGPLQERAAQSPGR